MNQFVKIINTIINIIITCILIVGIIFIILYVVGIEPFIVVSGSMEPAIKTGSLSFINKHYKYDDLEPNDIIAFTSSTGAKVTHRIVGITSEGIETKGDMNDISDGISTTRSNYLGKNIISVPKLGYFITLIQTTRGKIILISIIIVILLYSFLSDDKKEDKVEKIGKRASK